MLEFKLDSCRISLMFLTLCFLCFVKASYAQTNMESLLLDGTCLVSGSVREIRSVPGGNATKLKIEHVYSGKVLPEETDFVYYEAAVSDGGGNVPIYPPLQEEEQVIWLLDRDGNNVLRAMTRSRLRLAWPVRARHNSRYGQVKMLAEAIERLSQQPANARLEVLATYAASSTDEIAAWAIDMLDADFKTNLDSVLEKLLLNKHISMGAVIAIDEHLTRDKGAKWTEGQARRELLGEKTNADLSEYEANLLCTRLDDAMQLGSGKASDLTGWLAAMVKNEQVPIATRRQCLFTAGRMLRRDDYKSECFSLLASSIEGVSDPKLSFAAAHALKNSSDVLDKEQRGVVSDISRRISDAKLSGLLKASSERRTPKP